MAPSERPLTVSVDATSLLDRPTGVGVFARHLLDGLAARPDVVRPSTFAISFRGRRRLPGVVPPGTAVRSRPVPARLARPLWAHTSVPSATWLGGRADVVHGPNHVVPPDRHAAEVVTVHDLTAVRFPELCTPEVRRWPALLDRSVARGAWIHTPTEAVAEEVRERWPAAAERTVAIHHGITAAPPETSSTDAAEGRRLAGAERYVLAIGTVEPRKDLPGLVAAFDRIADDRPDVRLVVAGPDGWGTDEFLAARRSVRHPRRIVRLGWVYDGARLALLRGASVVAYPSRYEGFGFIPLEALAVGTPVVATRLPAIEEVTGDAALLVEPGDPDDLAAGLAAVLDGDDDTSARLALGHQRLDRLRWDAATDAFVDLYTRAAAARRR
jgi:glycosyltransferase involved in cell wall biosynthesis